jgi:hypothetical protein
MADSDRPGDGTGGAHLADIGPALKQEASRLADKSVSSGVEAADTVGKAAESAAQVLDESLPALAGYVRNCAQYTARLADDLRDKKAEELLSSAIGWSRQQPLIALAGAAVLGFALSRVARAGFGEASTSTEADGGDHAG